MSINSELEIHPGYAVFRATGEASLDAAIDAVTGAINSARERGVRKLVVDIAGLTGFEPPSTGKRFLLVNEWAIAAQGVVRVAVVVNRRMIHPDKYGVSVAHSLGFAADVFGTEEAATQWLLAED